MKKHVLMLGSILLFTVLCDRPVAGQEQIFVKQPETAEQKAKRIEYVPEEIIVKFKSGVLKKNRDALNAKWGMKELLTSPFAKFQKMRIAKGRTVPQMVEIYKQDPLVEYAEPNYIAYAAHVPTDELYPYQWHLDNPASSGINTEEAWDITMGNPGVIVAVVDTGVAYENYSEIVGFFRIERYYKAPDLAQTIFVPGYDFVNNDTHANDDEGHGTHVTGTIAQSTDNVVGTAGVAPDCAIMPVKVLASSGSGSYANVAAGIRWAADHNAKVINLSLGGSQPSTTLKDACTYAHSRGVTLLCAAGNDGTSSIIYPAAYDECCMAVGATRFDKTRSYYSNYGNGLDIVGPGGDVTIDQNGDGYGDGVLQQTFGNQRNAWGYYLYQGTSMATPHVSGAAALLISNGVASTPDEVREVLQSTAQDLGADGYDQDFGWGLVDAFAALNYATVPNTPPEANAGGPYFGTEDISVAFSGAVSSDADGDPVTYAWDFGDGSTGSGPNPSHTYTAGGTYTITLTVNDGKINSEPAVTTATITEVNDPPVADAGGPYSGLTTEPVSFNGSGSYDFDGDPLGYVWEFGDGNSSTLANPTHAYAAEGTYTASLTVTDGKGGSDTDSTSVQITVEVNEPPVAAAGADKSAFVGETVNFDGSASFDNDGSIISYAWDYGDTVTGTGVTAAHAYTSAGAYTVTLTVTDDKGATDTDALIVTVNEAPSTMEVFFDSFEVNEWNGLWSEDSQNDWIRGSARSVDGNYAAEVDGRARDAELISIPVNLQGKTNATITFSWYIARFLDQNEYLAFDVSTNGGSSWTERKRLRGNVDAENTWHQESVDVTNITALRLRFRGYMSSSLEDGDVDNVKVTAW